LGFVHRVFFAETNAVEIAKHSIIVGFFPKDRGQNSVDEQAHFSTRSAYHLG